MATLESVREVKELLRGISATGTVGPVDVSTIQERVWSLEGEWPSETAEEVLRDLAYDLEYFEADPTVRAESTEYYGPSRALEEIRAALEKLSGIPELH